jgi:hypothetical protein
LQGARHAGFAQDSAKMRGAPRRASPKPGQGSSHPVFEGSFQCLAHDGAEEDEPPCLVSAAGSGNGLRKSQ